MNNQKRPFTTKEFIIMVIIGVAIWWIPKWVFKLEGIIISALLPVIGFTIGHWIVMLLRKIKRKDNNEPTTNTI